MAAVYDGITAELAYISRDLGRRVSALESAQDGGSGVEAEALPRAVTRYLLCLGLLAPCSDEDRLAPYQRALIPGPFRVLDIIPTFDCNLACTYCYQREARREGQRWRGVRLQDHEAAQLVDAFLDSQGPQQEGRQMPVEICIFGGEPLLHPRSVTAIVERARRHRNGSCDALRLTVVTNGTLITPESAAVFAAHDVFVIVSIDGRNEVHDRVRVTEAGTGSFERSVTGYRRAQDAGCRVGISQLVGEHNVPSYRQEVSYLLGALSPDDMCSNGCFHGLAGDRSEDRPGVPPSVFASEFSRLIEGLCLRPSRDEPTAADSLLTRLRGRLPHPGRGTDVWPGTPEAMRHAPPVPEQFGRRFERILRRSPAVHYCPAQRDKLVVGPSGEAWCCEGFAYLGHGGRPWRDWLSRVPFTERTRERWASASPVRNPACHACPLILQCGLGCRFDAAREGGDLLARDHYRCELERHLFEWFVLEFVPLFCRIAPHGSTVRRLTDRHRASLRSALGLKDSAVAWR